eukprot:SAG31_NODE_19476_length_600_cov_1.536926_1_plen_143_part_10
MYAPSMRAQLLDDDDMMRAALLSSSAQGGGSRTGSRLARARIRMSAVTYMYAVVSSDVRTSSSYLPPGMGVCTGRTAVPAVSWMLSSHRARQAKQSTQSSRIPDMRSDFRGPELNLAYRTLSRSYHATSRTQCVKLVELYKTT